MSPRAASLVVLALLCAGCGFKDEPIGSLPEFPQTATDALGRRVVVEDAPRSVVSLDPGATASLFEIGAARLLKGGTGTETEPPRAQRLKPMLTEDGAPDVKAIAKAAPDLVVVPLELAPTEAEANALATRLASNVYVTDDTSVAGIEHDIIQLGLLTGHATQARAVFSDVNGRVQAIEEQYAEDDPIPVFVDKGYFYTIRPDTLAADLIRLAGGVNVAADADVSKPFGGAELRTAAPNVYLALAGSGVTLQGLKRSPATRDLPAVQDRRFAIIPAAVLERDGPRVADSLETLAKAMHADDATTG
jgi:iron complex transport system substrate-binding protein